MKKILITLLFVFSICCLSNNVTKAAGESETPDDDVIVDEKDLAENSRSAILIEVSTNKVIFQKESHRRMYPASMTKVMTMILVMEAIDQKIIKLDTMVTASKAASKQTGSKIFLSENEQMSVNDLLKGVCIASGNDAAFALAEKVAGSEKVFVKMMNQKKDELGLKNTNFINVTGLSDKDHYSSAYDMAMMSAYLINRYPSILEYTKIYDDYLRKDTASPFWLVNTNKLVKTHPEVDGLKTGWTEEALYCLSATMKREDLRFVSVVMGCKDPDVRSEDTLKLLEYGFSNYEKCKIFEKGSIISEEYNILYSPKKVEIKLSEDIYILKSKREELKEHRFELKLNDNYYSKPNDIGKIEIYYNNQFYSKHNLMIEGTLKKNNFFDLLKNLLVEFMN